jgi:hypothetical protein
MKIRLNYFQRQFGVTIPMTHFFRLLTLGGALALVVPSSAAPRSRGRIPIPVGPIIAMPSTPEPGTRAPAGISPRASALLDEFNKAMLRGFNNLRKRSDDFWQKRAQIVGTQTRVFFFDGLPLNKAQAFQLSFDGGKEGYYRLHGTLTKTEQNARDTKITLQLVRLECVRESEWDGLTADDEPMLFWTLNSLASQPNSWYSSPFEGVDKGESRQFARSTWPLIMATDAHALVWNVAVVEQDDANMTQREAGLKFFTEEFERQSQYSASALLQELRNPTPTAPAPTRPAPTPTPTPVPTSPPPTYDLSTWVDNWSTSYGRVKLELQGGVLRGRLMVATQNGQEREDAMLELRADGASNKLKGTSTYTGFQTQMTLALSADGQGFTGTNLLRGETKPNAWSGQRYRPSTTPTTPTTPATPTNPTGPFVPTEPQVPTAPRPGASDEFLPLKNFEVRVDKVAPNIDGDKLEAYVTLRNRTPQQQLINGSVIQGVATDQDGVGTMFMDFYQPEGAPTSIDGNHAIKPGSEFKVRLLVPIPQGSSPLQTLTLWKRGSQPQSVDISGVRTPGFKPAANFATMGLRGGTGEFKPCGKTLDVRFEGFRKARDGSFEAFFTFKNTSESMLRPDVLDMHSSSVDIDLHDANGEKSRHDEVMRPNGNTPIPMNHVGVLPGGGETKFRYRFRPNAGFVPAKLSVHDRPSKTTIEWALP